ncbi:acyl carrier protein [Aliarcobacter cryaerophilus]|uniref:acyl carrier protein n=1 Tax=Aliarcobacter cryaerophilus TaxID=28198 RepID=UPI003DA6618B
MENKIKKILEEVLDVEINENISSENCEDWDSMNQVNIVLELQDEFGIKIPMDDVMKLNSYSSILEYVKSKIQN